MTGAAGLCVRVSHVTSNMANGRVHLRYDHVLHRARTRKHPVQINHALLLVERCIHVNGMKTILTHVRRFDYTFEGIYISGAVFMSCRDQCSFRFVVRKIQTTVV